MPELPEVETIRRGLQEYLVGHVIQEIYIKDSRIFASDSSLIVDTPITNVGRMGKGLVVQFANEYALAIHLKMTGQLIYQSPVTSRLSLSAKVGGKLPNKYTRVIFELDQRGTLFYNDVRRFGWMKVAKQDEIKNLPFFKALGPEPFKDLTLEYFKKITSLLNTPIKNLLMDQSRIGGIGNIYANDALWEAKIDPRRKASDLNNSEKERLYFAIHDVITFSITQGAASDTNYVNALGEEGGYQKYFKVYSRAGEKCKRCSGIITRIKLSGRGTFFCDSCQK